MIFTSITCPSNIYILFFNYFALVMYISVGGWTRNTIMHAAATLGYITNNATNTRVCQSHLQKKSTTLKYYSLAYTFTYEDGEFIDIYIRNCLPIQERSRGQS